MFLVTVYAIESWNCYQFRHFGSIEGMGGYLLSRRDFTQADVSLPPGPQSRTRPRFSSSCTAMAAALPDQQRQLPRPDL